MEVNPNVMDSADILDLDFDFDFDYNYILEDCIDCFKNLPSGIRFATEQELITSCQKPQPRNQIIQANVYQYNPNILTEIYKEKDNGKGEWHFFTPRERKYPNGDRPNRSTGDGYWKASGADKSIKDARNIVVGFKKSLVFYEGKAPRGRKSHWIMHEYRINDAPRRKRTSANDMILDEVLCMIYYNTTHKSKTITGTDDEDPSTSNPTSAGSTTSSHDHLIASTSNLTSAGSKTTSHDHLIASTSNPTSVESAPSHYHHPIDKPVVDMHYCMQQQQHNYMLPQQYNTMMPQQQQLQNASRINDQPNYMAPNRPDHQFPGPGGNNVVANRPDNHQFTGVDSSNYGDQYYTMQGICTDNDFDDLLSKILNYNPMDDDILNDDLGWDHL
ncbi:NAC domain-containing protein 2-like [Corylus avellana]|uniref:NAC domain-containing protein 2-like n=1 Tax=Corylus avellana TaxID=13451 RepID=UPI001E231957|nr:NAC domain-containing protein 2-like [Corylus avellana]